MASARPSAKRWFATSATRAARYDDIHFLSKDLGWAINSNGQIVKTKDGGEHWCEQAHYSEQWLRCISMVNDQVGWVGSMNGDLYTTTDGQSWRPVTNLPQNRPLAICGLHALPDGKHVFAAGTNNPAQPTRFLQSSDGGESWTCREMRPCAALLVDVYFENECNGWVTGGRSDLPEPNRVDVVAAIWHTDNGGETWKEVVGDQVKGPQGEWGWKLQFVDDNFIVVATESYSGAAILISEDHGQKWRRCEIRDAQGMLINSDLEGIGFLDRRRGWVGGWGKKRDDRPGGAQEKKGGETSMTEDGGETWREATPDFEPLDFEPQLPAVSGQYINRFRVTGGSEPVIYAAGNTVYKYTDAPVRDPFLGAERPPPLVNLQELLRVRDRQVSFTVELPPDAQRLVINIYDRFADKKRTIVEDDPRPPGPRPVSWDIVDDHGRQFPPGAYILRVSCDHRSESRMIFVEPHDVLDGGGQG